MKLNWCAVHAACCLLPADWAAATGQDFTANHQIKTIDCEAG